MYLLFHPAVQVLQQQNELKQPSLSFTVLENGLQTNPSTMINLIVIFTNAK